MSRAAAALFNFRQRAGKLDWRQISSISVDDVVLNWKVEDLQLVLDHVTFAEFLPSDVKHNTIDSVAKLVQIMQLIIEYLLNHQEVQLQQLRGAVKKASSAKAQRNKLNKENQCLAEEVRTYQRQLHVLRKSLQAAGVAPTEADHRGGAKLLDPLAQQEDRDSSVLLALLEHEKSSREMMARMLDDQRGAFASEVSALLGAVKDIKTSSDSAGDAQKLLMMFESMRKQFEGQCAQILQQTAARPAPAPSSSQSLPQTQSIAQSNAHGRDARDDELTNLMRQQAALEGYERELRQREAALVQRERQQLQLQSQQQQHQHQQQQQAQQLTAMPAAAAVATMKPPLSLAVSQQQAVARISKLSAARMLFSVLRQSQRGALSRRYRAWTCMTQELRSIADLDLQARRLSYTPTAPSINEMNLLQKLQAEQTASLTLEARCHTLSRELKSATDRLEAERAGQQTRIRLEQELQAQAKAEKDRAVVLSAKFNTLSLRADKERAELTAQLAAAQAVIAQQNSDNSSAADMSTSSLTMPSRISNMMSSSRMGVSAAEEVRQQRYLGGDDQDEHSLLAQALARIASRGPYAQHGATAGKAALLTLAEDLSHVLPASAF